MIKTILILNDDESSLAFLKEAFTQRDYKVYTASNVADLIHNVQEKSPDILLVDLDLQNSEITGESICQEIKNSFPSLPIVVITSNASTTDLVQAFSIGVDDFVSKPYDIDELAARIEARCSDTTEVEEYIAGSVKVDELNKKVHVGKIEISLTPKEYELLLYLVQNKDRVLSRDLILNKVWMNREYVDERVVDVYIGYLRRKLDPKNLEKYIRTVRGFGYQIVHE